MIRRSSPVTDREAVAKGFGEIGLGCLYGIVHSLASRQVGRDGRGKRTAGAVCVWRIDELSFEHIEKIPVIEQIGGSVCREMAALDQYIFAAELMNDFSGAARVRERVDLHAG